MRGISGAGSGNVCSRTFLHLSLIVAAVSISYLNSFRGVFQFDDFHAIAQNQVVHSFSAWLADLRHGIRPLLKLTYVVSWVSCPTVFSFHIFNLLVHLANSVLVYHLVQSVTECSSAIEQNNRPRAALFAALIFALHPVQTEAVTYVSGRSSSLMALLYLGSMLTYIRGVTTGNRHLTLIVSPIFFLLAMLTKEPAITLPGALLLWEVTRVPRQRFRAALGRQVTHWSLLALSLLGLLLHPGYRRLLASQDIGANLLTQANGIAYLVSHIIMPGRLNIDPDLPVLTSLSVPLAAKVLCLAAALVGGMVSLRRKPWLAFCLLWFFLLFVPTNTIVLRSDVANDRQMYLPFFAIALFVGIGVIRLEGLFEGRRRLISVLVTLLIVTLGSLTVARNRLYESEIALWENAQQHSPEKARVFNNLGCAYLSAHRAEEAKAAFRTALRIDSHYELARHNLAVLAHRAEARRP